MGNHNSFILGDPSDDLKFKTGAKLDVVPSPGGAASTTYEKLTGLGNFKNYLLGHLDSTYFISSILQHSFDDSTLLQGIQHFMSMDPQYRTDVMTSIKTFQKLSAAGVCVSILFFIRIISCRYSFFFFR